MSDRLIGLVLGLISLTGMLVACNPFDPKPEPSAIANATYSVGDYKIGPEDVLEVIVWRNQDLSKVVTVRPDGKVSLPLIGDVVAVGLTPDQLTKEVISRLKDYKENPNVSVVVQQVNSYGIYVLGEVAHPGKYQLKSYTTVLQAVSMAGGFTPYAAKNKMFMLRKIPDKDTEVRIPIDYDEIVSGEDSTHNAIMIPGDTLVVP
ncbi:MAG TPA: polysaccharide biosynthesis/export family protein [Nitrospiraceae bacterium]|nr:polysaccharide biosynthesis/export family protein [Nitrospiraceae bacterium]